ncbi:hypothetical protein NB311A_05720 [Nitrobacter sp. Nb-311A]|nr:hypothetical protein NB311A_05720 [Nitrobacter sp. Nb-311A]
MPVEISGYESAAGCAWRNAMVRKSDATCDSSSKRLTAAFSQVAGSRDPEPT